MELLKILLKRKKCYSNLFRSLDPVLNKKNILNIKESAGKSGSFFFFTYDQNFIIKTITSGELKTMLGAFMKNYYEHINLNPKSLLSRIYGVYEVIIKYTFICFIFKFNNLVEYLKSV